MGLFKGFLGIFLPLCLVLAVVGSLHYYTSYSAERSTREASEFLNVGLARRTINSDIRTVVSDLMFLAEHLQLRGLLDAATVTGTSRISQEFLTSHYHPGLPTLYGDATKLRQVFSNLISNALQAIDKVENPQVSIDTMVELGQAGTGIRVEICDNGSGISEDERERIFEPFFTTRSKDTGLGLAIVRRILDQHRATISIEPNQPRGTCVSIVLPVTPQTNRSRDEVAEK